MLWSSTASLLRHQLRCTTMSRHCLRALYARYACAGTAKRPMHVGKQVPVDERALARRRSASWVALWHETAARWPSEQNPSPATTSQCSRPLGHSLGGAVRWADWRAGLANCLRCLRAGSDSGCPPPHGHGQTMLPREAAPSGHQGMNPQRCMCRPICIPGSSP